MVIQIFLVKMVVGILITQAQELMIADSSLLWRYLLSDKQTIHCTHSPIIRLLSQAWMGINWKQLTEEWTWFICRNCWDLHTLWFCVLVTKYNRKTYFINCNLQTKNKQNLLPPALPVPLVTENHLLLPTPLS